MAASRRNSHTSRRQRDSRCHNLDRTLVQTTVFNKCTEVRRAACGDWWRVRRDGGGVARGGGRGAEGGRGEGGGVGGGGGRGAEKQGRLPLHVTPHASPSRATSRRTP